MKSTIITNIFNDKELENLALKYDQNGDLWSEVMTYLCEMDEEKIIHMNDNNFLRYHIVACITRSSLMYQNYTRFNKKITLNNDITNDDICEEYHENFIIDEIEMSTDEVVNLVNNVLNLENTYDKELFKLIIFGVDLGNGEYKKYKSIAELSRETGISYTTLVNSYKRTIKRINEKTKNIIGRGWQTQRC